MELNPLGDDGIYVLELSSYQLETSPSFHAEVSVLLNITPDHLERHGGMEGYIAAKKLIYKNSTSIDTLVISVDDPHCLSIYEALAISKKVNLLPVSISKILSNGLYIQEGHLYEKDEPLLNLRKFDRLRGTHNWQNIAAAYGALRSLGVSAEMIRSGIASFPGLAHRQQIVAQYKNLTFVNDSKATNAEAVAKALSCYQNSSLYCLLGGRPNEWGIANLKSFFPSIKHAFLYGEAASTFALTLEGKVPYTLCNTLEEAVNAATNLALHDQHKEAVVLLSPACASFDQFRDFEARGEAFCHYVEAAIRQDL
jgi:UDP-N-acetylmuramoylalanine--D-glutamate ligase